VVIGTVPPSRITAGSAPFSRRRTAAAAARSGWSAPTALLLADLGVTKSHKWISECQRMKHKLRTKRGRAIYAKRGASVEPVFGQMKDRQGAGQFSMRGLGACQGE